jgi:hypothetical protein
VLAGSLVGQSIPLDGQLAIGRGYGEPGALGGDRRLSRRHARIARGDGGVYYIEDTGSTNGTRVNGEMVLAPRALRDGDEIEVGSTRLRTRGVPAALPVMDDSFDRNSPGYDEPVTAPRGRPVAPSPVAPVPPAGGPAAPAPVPGFGGLAAPSPVPVGAAASGAPPLGAAASQLYVPQGAASTRLGTRRLVAVFATVFVLALLVGLGLVVLASPSGSHACPNGFVCEKPPTAPALQSLATFRGALGWHVEYDKTQLRPAASSIAGNRLLLQAKTSSGQVVVSVEVRGFSAAHESARAAVTAEGHRLSSILVGAATAPSSDQIFTVPTLGFHPGVGEALEGPLRTPQGPGSLVKVTSVAATSGNVTVVVGAVYILRTDSSIDKALDQIADSVVDTVRFPSDGQL